MTQGVTSPFAGTVAPLLAGRTVLQIIPELEAGGAERTTIDIAEALTETGARALVACLGGRLVSELQAKGGLWVPFPAKTKNPIAMGLNIRKLMGLIRRERVDIVHARSRAPAWVAFVATRRTRTPFVTTFHGAYSGRSGLKLQYNSVMARGDVVIANSQYTQDLIARHYPFARDNIRVIYRGTDFRAFSPGAVDPTRVRRLREEWGVAADQRIVLLAARLTGWKGQRILIEAARRLADKGTQDVRYILAGDDQGRSSYVAELDGLIASARLDGVVRRVGHCRDMPAAYLAAAAVVVPSTEPEAFGRTAVEAQAMGTPVVVSNLGAVPETVLAPPDVQPQARTGWRIPAGDADALAEAIAAALSLGAAARDALALRARAHVEGRFSVDLMKRQTLDVYTALLER
ncbi:MAG: glycosyltransferase family 4 protein [Methylobacteriaceae bacterium]|nr:glycosyltransferase family 4 protein [Methylobacteriaceae bacterium]MBV9637258.1 glycosyltransferase family 4 protein [Methylobacteriaceae bacterium]MBV9705764.1 glycosyltransferase family 4 protein [Methylobacteriaceae bacterium]